MKRILTVLTAALWLTGATPEGSSATPPDGYPLSYAHIIEAARQEGSLSIYSATDASEAAPLIRAFEATYPGVRVEYADQNSTELYSRFIAEVAAGQGTADLVWSSAMDLQVKLIHDGYAQAYASPEKPNLPDWAVWKDEGYGVTAEPLVIAYNKRLMPPGDVPRTRADLERLLRAKKDFYQGKVASYDPERSGVGFLFISQDVQVRQDTWRLVEALAGTQPRLYTSTGAMLERLVSGEHLLVYNMIGSYALQRQKKDPSVGIVFPADFTLTLSRIAFIPTEARHPNAAKLFLDFLLSKRGQALLAQRDMSPVRADLGDTGVPTPPAEQVRAIRVGPQLLANLDPLTRLRFLKQWKRIVRGR
ncbi:ABC transporter substrate-binding protein [Stigmatella sp. ncwal1]|uniref:ABC transporter substrate-binding protein n=1 Tax=Stigmatella ashevillensis TaxID=2995309 RepID=A0ABT5DEL2_9BACT|nr:ABC transporter substrate-binding protein [Stigmatella ashevillena]MDC0711951.1 ABC transporter substrate-binding protein [Stigmatella ashevillena]